MSTKANKTCSGPFQASQIPAGSRYELSDGHPLYCAPTGARGSRSNLVGGAVLDTDPDVLAAGVDTGFSPEPGTLRAPDIAVGNVPDQPGWVQGVPSLAVEYADTGQDEADLQCKIRELLDAGTRYVWIVRLVGPRRVEVHEDGQPPRLVAEDEELTAPGVLRNPVPVAALFKRDAAHRQQLRNLLQREGYEDLDAVRTESRVEGKTEGMIAAIVTALEVRGLSVSDEQLARIHACRDANTLDRWLRCAIAAEGNVTEILDA